MNNALKQKLRETIVFIRKQTNAKPRVAIVLGSGLGDFAEKLNSRDTIATSKIPHYPHSTIEGHKGNIIFGKLFGIPLLAFQGRVHFYETGTLETALYPILVAHQLGIKTIILTNAAGGVNRNFKAGDLMLITDHINLTFENPLSILSPSLRKKNKNKDIYSHLLQQKILTISLQKNIQLQQGVYCCVKGPSYETAAEIEMIRRIGGDAVGMSTVNEATLAASLRMKVAGISCITNLATGISTTKLSHSEVTEVADRVKHTFAELLTSIILRIGKSVR
jgi:purine-nucleoside phosphorylase